MTNECIFCKIVAKESPAHIIGESENFLAFLSLGEITPGHSLVIPKEHCIEMSDFPKEHAVEWVEFIQEIMQLLKKAMGVDALNIGSNNGKESGQVVFHQHTHLIPRKEGDGLEGWKDNFKQVEDLEDIYAKIKSQQ